MERKGKELTDCITERRRERKRERRMANTNEGEWGKRRGKEENGSKDAEAETDRQTLAMSAADCSTYEGWGREEISC